MDDAGAPPALTPQEQELLESVFDAARQGETAKLGPLLDAGVPVNLTNARGDTLLILAAYHQHADTVDELLGRGAETNRVNDMGQTAISCAVFRNNQPIVAALIEAGGDPELGSHSALAIAKQFGLVEMQQFLS